MAIRDLLWACPLCGGERTIAGKRPERCAACGARFRRGPGSEIVAQRAGEPARARPAAEWTALLPPVAPLRPAATGAAALAHEEPAIARVAARDTALRGAGRFLGRIEHYGPPRRGHLRLSPDALVFSGEGEPIAMALDRITAVQPSSSTLQVKARDEPVVSFRFPQGSARFWEELLTATLRERYRARGRGEIVEFQPRIVTR
jgi:hypothetical protein